ncbi:MAG: hypothetical protein V4496_00865 [Pseudomonadota bacterium]
MTNNNNSISRWLCLNICCHASKVESEGMEALLREAQEADSKPSPSRAHDYLRATFWWGIYLISSVQPGLNAWNAAARLMYNADCSVGDFLCYGPAAWKDAKSIVVWLFVLCTFLDNVAIARVFMPDVMHTLCGSDESRLKKTWSEWGADLVAMITFENFIGMLASRKFYAFILAAACSLITYKLGVDSLTIFQTIFNGQGRILELFGLLLDVIMLSTAVFSTFATRMVGCETMLGVFLLWMPYLYPDKLFKCFVHQNSQKNSHLQQFLNGIIEDHPNKRMLLDVMHQCSLYEYNVDSDIRVQYLAAMNRYDYEEAVTIAHQNNLLGTSKNIGENIFYGCIQVFKALCYFIAVACYPVVYNITYGAFANVKGWLQTSYAAATANILFYMYALGRLADQSYRTIKMHLHSQIKSGGLWTIGLLGVFTAFGCANLLATALIQVKKGQLNNWGLPPAMVPVFFPLVLGCISGLTNGFGLARIDRIIFDKHLTASNGAGKKWVELITGASVERKADVASHIVSLRNNRAGTMYQQLETQESNPIHNRSRFGVQSA